MELSVNRSMKFTSNGFTDSTPKLILQDNSTITIDSIVEQTGIHLPKTGARFRTYSYLKKYSSCWFRNLAYWYCFFSSWKKHFSNWFINFSSWKKYFSYRFSSFSCSFRNFSCLKVKILIYIIIIKNQF